MTNPLTNDEHFHELLGAYLDNEVTPEERQRVDRALNADPLARKMLDNLRGLKADVSELPRYELEEDFHERVLRQAQREMLRGDRAATIPLDAVQPRRAGQRRWFLGTFSTWPRVAAAVLVLAPALTLIVLATRPGNEGERYTLSQKERENRLASDPTSGTPPGGALDGQTGQEGAGERRGRKEELAEQADTPGGSPSTTRSRPNKFQGGSGFGGAAPAPPAPALESLTTDALEVESDPTDGEAGLLVVHVAVTQQGWQSGEVAKLLAAGKRLAYNELGGDNRNRYFKDAPDLAQLAGKKGKASAELRQQVRLVNVEAPASDLRAVLAKLQGEAKTQRSVLALAVQPSPRQRRGDNHWLAYNQGANFFQMDATKREWLRSRVKLREGKPGRDEDDNDKSTTPPGGKPAPRKTTDQPTPSDDARKAEQPKPSQKLSRRAKNAAEKSPPEEPPREDKAPRSKGGPSKTDAAARRAPPSLNDQKSDRKGTPRARALIIFYVQPTPPAAATPASPPAK